MIAVMPARPFDSEPVHWLEAAGWTPVDRCGDTPAASEIDLLRSPEGGLFGLKAKASYLSDGEFRAHIDLQRFVHDRGGPVAAPAPGPQPLETGGRLYELQEWLEGRPPKRSAPDLADAAAALRSFHAIAEGFQWPKGSSIHKEPRSRFAKSRFYRRYLERALSPDWPDWSTALYLHLERASEIQGTEAKQPLHGDPAPDNAVRVDGSFRWIDLDDAHLGPVESDLAWLMTTAAAVVPGGLGEGMPCFETTWRRDLAAAILEGYLGGEPPSTEAILLSLQPWLVASVVCALVDYFLDGAEPRVLQSELHGQGHRALALLDDLPDLSEELS